MKIEANIKPRLAIVSTFDDLCGIAGYTRALLPQLEKIFTIEVFDLDQFLFRHETKYVQRLADKEIKRICQQLKYFDCVNIQLEHGTFGREAKDIFKRIQRIITASPSICVTFHTILPGEPYGLGDFLRATRKHGFNAAWNTLKSRRREQMLDSGIYRALASAQTVKPTSVIVHTRRDRRMLQTVHKLKNVFDHPLAFYAEHDREIYAAKAKTHPFPNLADLPEDSIILGCFGFISRYKGIDTAIEALKLLPENYHLAIFGGLHPNEIKKNQNLDPFLRDLLHSIQPGKQWLEGSSSNFSLTLSGGELVSLTSSTHPRDFSSRVHFIGALSDTDFPKAMMVCDCVLLPYVEVGQSSSGPMSVAVDMGKHIIASRTKAFMQFQKYHPDRMSLFEVGNFLQLSQIIKAEAKRNPYGTTSAPYTTETNSEIYRKALSLEHPGMRSMAIGAMRKIRTAAMPNPFAKSTAP